MVSWLFHAMLFWQTSCTSQQLEKAWTYTLYHNTQILRRHSSLRCFIFLCLVQMIQDKHTHRREATAWISGAKILKFRFLNLRSENNISHLYCILQFSKCKNQCQSYGKYFFDKTLSSPYALMQGAKVSSIN